MSGAASSAPQRGLTALLALLAGACAAGNPSRAELRPADVRSAAEPAAPRQTAPAQAAPEGSQRGEPPQGASEQAPALVLGSVGGETIAAEELLERLWIRDSAQARELLEQIVFSRLALLEADRLGIRIDEVLVDQLVDEAWSEMGRRLAEGGSPLTPREHVRQRLGIDPERYERALRRDAIVQRLAERAVRAWVLESPRVRVRVMDLPDEGTLARVRAELAAGADFVELARAHGIEEQRATGGTELVLVRAESHEIARLAFATPVGEVAGPLTQGERRLLLRVEERLEPLEGDWSALGPEVERSLARAPVEDLEYVQWRAAMVRRYRVDLEPFLALVAPDAP